MIRLVIPYDDDEVKLMKKDILTTFFEMTLPIPSAKLDEAKHREDSKYMANIWLL